MSLTLTSCPSFNTSDGWFSRRFSIWLTCTRPSRFPKKFTKAPKSTNFTTVPVYMLPTSGSATIEWIISYAFWIDAPSGEAILIVPSSLMSTLAPDVSTISRITLPPDPITSRILSVATFIVSILGACTLNSPASEIALDISLSMCMRPSFA